MKLLLALLALVAPLCLPQTAAAQSPAPPPLTYFSALPGVEDMALSPNGENIAVAARLMGERMVVVLDKDRKIVRRTLLSEHKLRYLQWVGNDTVLVATSSTEKLGPGFTTDKHEFTQTVLLYLDGRTPEVVFDDARKRPNTTFGNYGRRLVGGEWKSYFGGIEFVRTNAGGIKDFVFDHGRPGLYEVDIATNKAARIAAPPPEGRWRDWLVDKSGKVAATLDKHRDSGKWDLANSEGRTIASGQDLTGDVWLIALGEDGASVIYGTEDDSAGRTHWYSVPLGGGEPVEVFADTAIERIYTDPASGRLIGYLEDGTPPKPVVFDPRGAKVFAAVRNAFGEKQVSIAEWTEDFSHVLVRTSGNGDSGTWFVVDLAEGTADPVGNERIEITPEMVGPISQFDYAAGDGLELDGILTLPPGLTARNLPVIAFPHGGPQSADKVDFDWWAQAFASRGYAVFQPNFRGSTHRDDAFRRAGYGQWGRKMQTDISDGVAALAVAGIVDPSRACIMGASYGGYAALAGVTLQNGLYRCAVAVAPVSDLTDLFRTDIRAAGRSKVIRRGYEESLGDPRTFAEVSPRRHAARADAPILLIHGNDDTRVPVNQSKAMADKLDDAGKPYEMIVLDEEDHWLSRSETRQQMLEAAMNFVLRHNPPD